MIEILGVIIDQSLFIGRWNPTAGQRSHPDIHRQFTDLVFCKMATPTSIQTVKLDLPLSCTESYKKKTILPQMHLFLKVSVQCPFSKVLFLMVRSLLFLDSIRFYVRVAQNKCENQNGGSF